MRTAQAVVLHVDDDPNDVVLFQHACHKAKVSFRIEVAADAQKAIGYLSGAGDYADRAIFPPPSLIVLDLKMPRLSGLEVLMWVRKHETLKRLPVVVLSSSSHLEDIHQAYDLGINSFLLKPLHFEELVEIARLVDRYWIGINRTPPFS